MNVKTQRFGKIKSISYIIPVIIVVVLIIAFVAGYLVGVGSSTVTSIQTTTKTTTASATASASPTCVTLKNCPSSYVYIVYGASKNIGIALNPANITVIIGVNNTVTWENLDTVTQTLNGPNTFSTQTIAPGQSFSYTFSSVGTFSYSSPTFSFEKGTVTVVQSTATTSAVGSNPDDNY